MPTRTTVILDERSRRAAKTLAAKLDVSPSEVIRRALIHYCDHVQGAPLDVRRRQQRALRRLRKLFEGHDADAEIRRLKLEDAGF